MWSIPVLYLSSRAMARPIFTSLSAVQQDTGKHEPDDRDTVDHAFSANDGVVPIFSQWHPFDCSATKCRHQTYPLDDSRVHGYQSPSEVPVRHEDAEKGVWHVYHIDAAHHFSLVPFWMGTARQKAFWRDLGSWLDAKWAMAYSK
ncbi:hypothetical protein C8Q72DRAFT_427522 [Fomitopsis betulina]|nr:hypothetical protein C8Q72DRAFT_427522 [Fomitopsis betulina]